MQWTSVQDPVPKEPDLPQASELVARIKLAYAIGKDDNDLPGKIRRDQGNQILIINLKANLKSQHDTRNHN